MAFSNKALKLIIDFEGINQPGKWPGAQSGITLGYGYDLGYVTVDDFESDWDECFTDEQFGRLRPGGRQARPAGSGARALPIRYQMLGHGCAARAAPAHPSRLHRQSPPSFRGIRPAPARRAGRARVAGVQPRHIDEGQPRPGPPPRNARDPRSGSAHGPRRHRGAAAVDEASLARSRARRLDPAARGGSRVGRVVHCAAFDTGPAPGVRRHASDLSWCGQEAGPEESGREEAHESQENIGKKGRREQIKTPSGKRALSVGCIPHRPLVREAGADGPCDTLSTASELSSILGDRNDTSSDRIDRTNAAVQVVEGRPQHDARRHHGRPRGPARAAARAGWTPRKSRT